MGKKWVTEMQPKYTQEKNALVLISLLKSHGIRYIVASPGNTNTSFIGSVQVDPFFKIFSCVDERSAAYVACGISAEKSEPVVISCTGATASRNYLPGLTEAFYRKLPILAVTSTQPISRVGHHVAQVIDRSSIQNDVVKCSLTLPIVKDEEDLWECEIKVNTAILELSRKGGGPAHLNLPTTYKTPFNVTKIPDFKVIHRIERDDPLPELNGRVAVYVGAHKRWSKEDEQALENFAISNDAPVFCDHTSSYHGKNRLLFALVSGQEMADVKIFQPDVLIHIGEVSGDYFNHGIAGKTVWRVSEDGEVRDTFRRLRYVFEMKENNFFQKYTVNQGDSNNGYFEMCKKALEETRKRIPTLPFSNVWIASKLAKDVPCNSVIHFGILNSLRAWNFFEINKNVETDCNVGGFGIDGCLSSLVGASLTNQNKNYYAVVGDLAFFYDINILGNRHIKSNVRILLINNGTGIEFKNYNHHAAYFGKDADNYIAASGHFGKQSEKLVKDFVENLGFDYLCAHNKDEAENAFMKFMSPEKTAKPLVLEIFTNENDESEALNKILRITTNNVGLTKHVIRKTAGPHIIKMAKKIINRD